MTSSLLLPEYRSIRAGNAAFPGSALSSGTATPTTPSRSASPGPSTALSTLSAGAPIGVDHPSGCVTPAHRRCLCNTPLQTLVAEEGQQLCGAAESRSRSRHPRMAHRSRSAQRRAQTAAAAAAATDAGEEDVEVDGDGDDDDDGDDGLRGRARRRKIGETFPVPLDPSGDSTYSAAMASAAAASRLGGLAPPPTARQPVPSVIRRDLALQGLVASHA